MGDISAEPSMEDILSSIKRIIAEEGDSATAASRAKRQARTMPPRPDPAPFGHDEILELSDPVRAVDEDRPSFDEVPQAPVPVQPLLAVKPQMPKQAESPTVSLSAPAAEPILSPRTAEASRGPLDALSRMVVKPETPGGDSLEAMVREMLRPMLRDWLDAKLPELVEEMVAREISRITGQSR